MQNATMENIKTIKFTKGLFIYIGCICIGFHIGLPSALCSSNLSRISVGQIISVPRGREYDTGAPFVVLSVVPGFVVSGFVVVSDESVFVVDSSSS